MSAVFCSKVVATDFPISTQPIMYFPLGETIMSYEKLLCSKDVEIADLQFQKKSQEEEHQKALEELYKKLKDMETDKVEALSFEILKLQDALRKAETKKDKLKNSFRDFKKETKKDRADLKKQMEDLTTKLDEESKKLQDSSAEFERKLQEAVLNGEKLRAQDAEFLKTSEANYSDKVMIEYLDFQAYKTKSQLQSLRKEFQSQSEWISEFLSSNGKLISEVYKNQQISKDLNQKAVEQWEQKEMEYETEIEMLRERLEAIQGGNI
ncbi:unnamed protein product [Caenorhabditis nigoni]